MPDRTMRYMARFRCIGGDCEDNCCHGWQVDIDPKTWERLTKVTALTSEDERKRFKRGTKTQLKDGYRRRLLRMLPDGKCHMLEADGLCHIQGTFGEKMLPDVCAIYPRSIQFLQDDIELSGMASCPEMARQLLLHDDAIDEVPLDRATLSRPHPSGGMDPRDVRPYWRLMLEVRGFLLQLLRDKTYTLEQRLFFMTWFAKRTSQILNKKTMKADPAPVRAEMELLSDAKQREEIAKRFDGLKTPSSLVLLLARELVRDSGFRGRDDYGAMVSAVFSSYVDLEPLLPDGAPQSTVSMDRVWQNYNERKERLRRLVPDRMERVFMHGAYNYWMHHLPLGSPDLQTHMLRLLALMAAQKLLLVSHPRVLTATDENLPAAFDSAAVEVFFRVARHVEHSTLLHNLEKALARKELASIAGAVYLVRF